MTMIYTYNKIEPLWTAHATSSNATPSNATSTHATSPCATANDETSKLHVQEKGPIG
jgi:hypothetical protein